MKKIIVGKRVSNWNLAAAAGISAFLALLFANLLAIVCGRNWFWLLWIGFTIMNLVLYIPVVATSHKIWLVEGDHIAYARIPRWIDQMRYALRRGNSTEFLIRVPVHGIESIHMRWTTQLSLWSTTSYTLVMDVKRKDGSLVTIDALKQDPKNFVQAMEALKQAHVVVDDPYDLIEAVREGKDLWMYIDACRHHHMKTRHCA